MQLNISLSASGFTLSYHQGILKGLNKRGMLSSNTKYTGTSGGAVSAILTKGGILPEKQLYLTQELLSNYIEKDECISLQLERYLERELPSDVAVLCNDMVTCSMYKFGWPFPKSYMLKEYKNKKDVIDATISSCYIPFLIGETLTWNFRGERHVDGAFNKERFLVKLPDNQTNIHIAALPKSKLDNLKLDFVDVYMGLSGELPYNDEFLSYTTYNLKENTEINICEYCNELYKLGENDIDYYISQRF